MIENFDTVLEEILDISTRIVIRHEKKGEVLAKYNEHQRDKVREYLQTHDCKTFIHGTGDGYLDIIATKDGVRLCKYCGKEHETHDENLLCSDCRETFGHTFYTEL